MGLFWNGVRIREANPASPELSVMPLAESRATMRAWFQWQDLVSQAASKAFVGYVQVATGYQPLQNDPQIPAANWQPVPGLSGAASRLYFACTVPFIHPDWNPNNSQFFLCDGFENVRGSVPNSPSIGPNLTATFDEANTVLHFRTPPNGYRAFPDYLTLDFAGDPLKGGLGVVPREYFCLRNMEVIEQTTSKAQSIPGISGLQWQTLAPANPQQPGAPAQPGAGNGTNVSAYNYVTLHEGEITLKWYPVPVAGYNEPAALALVGKTNSLPFPPSPPAVVLANSPAPLFSTRAAGTLVWGQPGKRVIRMGDCGLAYEITFKLKYHPYGANSFFWWNPPASARGRMNIRAGGQPFPDPNLGGPGYYPVQRPNGGGPLFPAADYRAAFVPLGETFP